MPLSLTEEEKVRYARIMYNSQGRQQKEIDGLTLQQLQKLRSIYAQKIAFETVNGRIQAFDQPDQPRQHRPQIPNLFTSLLCCCFPQQNQDYFDITTSIFLQRVFYPFLFWQNRFQEIGQGKAEQYGLVWLIITYTIFICLASALNKYFIQPANYVIEYEMMLQCLGIVLIFKIAQPLIYSSVIGCLGGFIQSNQSIMLSSYSLVLYFIPTVFCMAPSLYWHATMLLGGSLFRIIFLYRNYETKLQSKGYILLFVLIIIEAIYDFILLRTMFYQDKGYDFTVGFYAVFNQNVTDTNGKPASINTEHHNHMLVYNHTRHYQI